jgi:hypothetical protein
MAVARANEIQFASANFVAHFAIDFLSAEVIILMRTLAALLNRIVSRIQSYDRE